MGYNHPFVFNPQGTIIEMWDFSIPVFHHPLFFFARWDVDIPLFSISQCTFFVQWTGLPLSLLHPSRYHCRDVRQGHLSVFHHKMHHFLFMVLGYPSVFDYRDVGQGHPSVFHQPMVGGIQLFQSLAVAVVAVVVVVVCCCHTPQSYTHYKSIMPCLFWILGWMVFVFGFTGF